MTSSGSESADIAVPAGDPHFDPDSTGTQTIQFTRSNFDSTTGIDSPREQFNELTSFIDGSQVYGVDQATSDSGRRGQIFRSERIIRQNYEKVTLKLAIAVFRRPLPH